MWLALDIALVLLGLLLVGLAGLATWSRFRRMGRSGSRLGRRMSELGAEAATLGERLDAAEDDSRRQASRIQQARQRWPA